MQYSNRFLLFAFAFSSWYHGFAQSYKIGTIDIYGNRKISSSNVLAHLRVKEADSITHENYKPADEAAKLEQIPGVKHATVSPICCDTAGNLMLFIGIAETDSFILNHRDAPVQDIQLPEEMITAYRNLNDQMEPAIQSGQAVEDDSQGYALLNYKPARNEQNKFITFANRDFTLLANVLKNSRYVEHRAAAAQIIAYSTNRKKVAENLICSSNDPDEAVRNNSIRGLGVLADYLNRHPELKISIPTGSFIKMLNSIIWTDRNKAAMVLVKLSQDRDPKLLHKIKEQALASIIEMAGWKDRGHAFFAFVILGRISGVNEKSLVTKNFSADWAAETEAMVAKCHH